MNSLNILKTVAMIGLTWACSSVAHSAGTCSHYFSPLAINFGQHDSLGSQPKTAVSTTGFKFGCKGSVETPKVRICAGLHVSPWAAMNNLSGGTDQIIYGVAIDAGYTTAWGDTEGSYLITDYDVGEESVQFFSPPLYGYIPPGQPEPSQGDYADAAFWFGADAKALFYADGEDAPNCETLVNHPDASTMSPLVYRGQIKIAPSCEITANVLVFEWALSNFENSVAFGGSVHTRCTAGLDYSIAAGMGLNSQGDTRYLKQNDGSVLLAYELYRSSTWGGLWGELENQRIVSQGTGTIQFHSFYGDIPIPENTPLGTYTDTVLVTVHY